MSNSSDFQQHAIYQSSGASTTAPPNTFYYSDGTQAPAAVTNMPYPVTPASAPGSAQQHYYQQQQYSPQQQAAAQTTNLPYAGAMSPTAVAATYPSSVQANSYYPSTANTIYGDANNWTPQSPGSTALPTTPATNNASYQSYIQQQKQYQQPEANNSVYYAGAGPPPYDSTNSYLSNNSVPAPAAVQSPVAPHNDMPPPYMMPNNMSMEQSSQLLYQQQRPQQHQTTQHAYGAPQLSAAAMAPPAYGAPPVPAQTLEGARPVNLLAHRNILPPLGIEPPIPRIRNSYKEVYCDPDVFRCTLTAIPRSSAVLDKTRLPFGILIHPFRDLGNLQVMNVKQIIRCRACRTYINPWISFIDLTRWKCNVCFRQNEIPHDQQFDRQMMSPEGRPEVNTATVEYIASAEYALRPPQPAIYLFLLDVSFHAVESGYLTSFCRTMQQTLLRIPGDARRSIGVLAFDSALHFFSLVDLSSPTTAEGAAGRWREMIVGDLDDVFIPDPSGLIVNVEEYQNDLLKLFDFLPLRFADTRDMGVSAGAALQTAYKMLHGVGGRVTLFVGAMPNIGPGTLKQREDNNARASSEVKQLAPATDFYKSLSLECANQHIGVDLFVMSGLYCDISTLSNICNTSAGALHYYPAHTTKPPTPPVAYQFVKDLERYLTRKIGFEAVLRIRCTHGVSMKEFGGNFFVRSTDLVVLPVVNPDAGYAFKMEHDETLNDLSAVCFQAALLYTTAYGERRIRVHTLNIPIARDQEEVFAGADQEAIAAYVARLGAKYALEERSMDDVRQGTMMCAEDALNAYASIVRPIPQQLLAPQSLRCLPLFAQAAVKSIPFRAGVSTPLDWRAFAMQHMRQSPLHDVLHWIYPPMFRIDQILLEVLANDSRRQAEGGGRASFERRTDKQHRKQNGGVGGAQQPHNSDGECNGESDGCDDGEQPSANEDEDDYVVFPQTQLSSEFISADGIYLLDAVMHCILYVRRSVPPVLIQQLFGVPHYSAIPASPGFIGLPPYAVPSQQQDAEPVAAQSNAVTDAFCRFFQALRYDRRIGPALEVVTEDDRNRREVFLQYLHDDRQGKAASFFETLQSLSMRQTSRS